MTQYNVIWYDITCREVALSRGFDDVAAEARAEWNKYVLYLRPHTTPHSTVQDIIFHHAAWPCPVLTWLALPCPAKCWICIDREISNIFTCLALSKKFPSLLWPLQYSLPHYSSSLTVDHSDIWTSSSPSLTFIHDDDDDCRLLKRVDVVDFGPLTESAVRHLTIFYTGKVARSVHAKMEGTPLLLGLRELSKKQSRYTT